MNLRYRLAARCAVSLVVSLLAIDSTYAQSIRVTAANASNSRVYDVTFAGTGGTTTLLNDDQSVHVSIRSIVFVPNVATGQLDLVAADTPRGKILAYANSRGSAEVLWHSSNGVAHPAEGAGPIAPDGVSVDAAGNLYVTSSAPGGSTNAEVWVFPHNGVGPLVGGYGLPLLVDRAFGGVAVRLLEESLSVRMAVGGIGIGDLLVLASQPASVFRYSRAAIAGVLAGNGPVNPTATLLRASDFPKKEAPGGLDIWPYDGSLLITTGNGRVLRFLADGTRLADFASGLGNGKFKIRTGYEGSVALAVVADNNGGDILKFGAPPATGPNPPLARVTQGVERPQGVTISNIGITSASSCSQSAGGCNPLGNVLSHSIASAYQPTGSVIEEPCIVQVDPRITQFGTCRGHALNVASVCAGYEAVVIPDYLCGGSGPTGKGFALVNTTTTGSINVANALVSNEAYFENVIGGGLNSPPCPANVLGWAPKSDEGTIVEGAAMLELTGACGSSRAFSRDLSIWGIGLVLDIGALPGKNDPQKLYNFSTAKYDAINATIVAASAAITDATETELLSCLAASRKSFELAMYLNAAGQLLTCDQVIAQHLNAFSSTTANPNPSGELRGRLANLYLTLNTRMLGNPANANWPPGN